MEIPLFLNSSMESEMKQPWFYHYIYSYSYIWYNIAAECKIKLSPDSGVTWLELTIPDRFPHTRLRKTLCQHNLTEYNNNTSNMYFYLIVLCRWVLDHLNTIKDTTVSVDLWNSIVTPGNNASQRKTGYRFVLDSGNEAHPLIGIMHTWISIYTLGIEHY